MNGLRNLTQTVVNQVKYVNGEDPAIFVYVALVLIIVLSLSLA